MAVGQELLDVPLPDMVAKLGMGIAEAQHALDTNSIEIAKILADTEIEIVPAMTRTIKEDTVEYSTADPIEVSLLQVGLTPAFYQFSEATIEVEMDIKTTSEAETEIDVGTKGKVGFGLWSASISVDVKHNRKFGKEVHGTSKLTTKMVPVPPPPYLFPEVETIDLRASTSEGPGEGG